MTRQPAQLDRLLLRLPVPIDLLLRPSPLG
jgi:hypothetical protein